jgi:dTDP-4-dehydrorhamnose reductase
MGKDRRVLVTGARGMLGSDLCAVLGSGGCEVVAADIGEFDITDGGAARAFAADCQPSFIINCAAYTAVDGAETERELAFRVNRDGARNIAQAAADVGAPLVQISTDYVFDGQKTAPYLEEDAPNPLSAYGASKLAGELAVRETLAEHYVVRTAWLYGIRGKSFPRTILNLRLEGRALRVVSDQFGCPTYTVHLAQVLAEMIARPLYGTYHAVNSGSCTWYELACAVLSAAGLGAEMEAISASEFPRPAPRPANSVLDTGKLARTFGLRLPPWQEGVVEFVSRWRQEEAR